METRKISDISEITQRHGAQEITLPGWEPGEVFVCKAKRPSLFNMASAGMIPNPLMGAAQALFSGDKDSIDKVNLADQSRIAITIAKYALVEPTYQQLQDAGVDMTDEQLLVLYSFAIGGPRMLETFRHGIRAGAGGDGRDIPRDAVAPDAH